MILTLSEGNIPFHLTRIQRLFLLCLMSSWHLSHYEKQYLEIASNNTINSASYVGYIQPIVFCLGCTSHNKPLLFHIIL